MQTGRFASFFLSPDKPGTTPAPTVKTMFFHFYKAKVLDCIFCARRPFGPVGRKKIILAALRYFFPPSLATKNGQSKGMKPVKSGKTIPMGLFI